jgi:hypothetical protein
LETPQLLWIVNSVLVVALGFFIKSWMNDIKDTIRELRIEMSGKVNTELFDRVTDRLEKYSHSHSAGEVENR